MVRPAASANCKYRDDWQAVSSRVLLYHNPMYPFLLFRMMVVIICVPSCEVFVCVHEFRYGFSVHRW